MRKFIFTLLIIFVLLTVACTPNDINKENDQILLVSSFTIISDMAEQIGGDLVQVYNLVPTGTDPHEYEPTPNDIKAATDADILLYNGVNLEGGSSGWFFKMIDSVKQNQDRVFSLN